MGDSKVYFEYIQENWCSRYLNWRGCTMNIYIMKLLHLVQSFPTTQNWFLKKMPPYPCFINSKHLDSHDWLHIKSINSGLFKKEYITAVMLLIGNSSGCKKISSGLKRQISQFLRLKQIIWQVLPSLASIHTISLLNTYICCILPLLRGRIQHLKR